MIYVAARLVASAAQSVLTLRDPPHQYEPGVIRLRWASVTYDPTGCWFEFMDGTGYGSNPHETPHYREIAARCGYGSDLLAYCREHEYIHHVIGEELYRGPSPVLWQLAHGRPVDPGLAAVEEAAVMTLQRWVRAGERPIIGGVEWDRIKARCLSDLNAA